MPIPAFAGTFWFWAGVVVAIRVAALVLADGTLGPDEAQYWYWAQHPDVGYFSKPPMIAWVIGATTALFGDGEWAVRLAAPLLHAGTAVFIYLTADQLFDRRAAVFSGLTWLTLPGVSVSSFLITTDAPLLLFWAGALYFFFRISAGGATKVREFALLGLMIGLGLMSKYAMLYFPVAAGVTVALSAEARRAVLRPPLALTVLIAGLVAAPNVAWNAANDFQTVSHTAANANWASELFNIELLALFLGAQFAVFGPILFATLAAATVFILRNPNLNDSRFQLLVFAVTPIVIVSTQAFISRAHANWAAAAYPAATILAIAFLLHAGRARIAKASLALHAAVALAVVVFVANFEWLDRIGAGRAVKELRGWESLSAQIAARADGYDAVLFDDRSMIGEMLYYQRDRNLEIAALDPNNGVHHHFEAFLPFQPDRHQRSLFVSILGTEAHVDYRFADIEKIGVAQADIGDAQRRFTLFDISGYYGPASVQYTD